MNNKNYTNAVEAEKRADFQNAFVYLQACHKEGHAWGSYRLACAHIKNWPGCQSDMKFAMDCYEALACAEHGVPEKCRAYSAFNYAWQIRKDKSRRSECIKFLQLALKLDYCAYNHKGDEGVKKLLDKFGAPYVAVEEPKTDKKIKAIDDDGWEQSCFFA